MEETHMTPLRRIASGLAAALLCAAAAAQTGDYPTRPIRLITPFAAGGAIDVLCRVIGERLAQRLGQNILVESIPGANTIIGTQALLRAAPDGYTFMITTMSTTVNNRILYTKLSYDPEKDLAPITQLSYGTVLLVGPGNAPYKDLQGFIDWAKAQKRSISYGSWGIASWGHLAGEILKREAGLDLTHVPYKGDVFALTDVRNGTLDVTFTSPTSAKPLIASGAVKPIAMTGPQRSASMPELPTFTEQGVRNVDLPVWVGVYAPAGTPRAILERLRSELKAVTAQPDIVEKMTAQGQTPVVNTAEEFMANYRAEYPKWDALIKASGAKIE
jgi:tripartite-type tricarboxylate transporter receptor subunit TctC